MNDAMPNTYYLTDRYLRKMYKDIVLNEIITFVFYFVFNILFKDHPQYSSLKVAFGFIFMGIAVAMLILGKHRADQMASVRYEVRLNGLFHYDGKKEVLYFWSDFTDIKRNPNRISLLYPFEFHTTKGTFTLHRQLDNPDQLIKEIAKKTNIHVEI